MSTAPTTDRPGSAETSTRDEVLRVTQKSSTNTLFPGENAPPPMSPMLASTPISARLTVAYRGSDGSTLLFRNGTSMYG